MLLSNASSDANDTKRSTQSSLAAAMLASDLGANNNPPYPDSSRLEVPPPQEEYNDIGIPVVLLWLPYTTLSLVLVGLMVVSFIRFHFKHGHKYRRRRELFWKELNVQDILLRGAQAQQTTDRPPERGGGGAGLPRHTDRIDRIPPGCSTPPQFAWTEALQGKCDRDINRATTTNHSHPPPGGATDISGCVARQQTTQCRPKMSLAEAESSLRRRRSLLDRFRSSVCSRKRSRTRLPVPFSSNMNGSMVNIRCGEKESLSTFQKSRGLDTTTTSGLNCVPPHQPNRCGHVLSGHAQRRPDIWTVQTGYRPKLQPSSAAVSGTFGLGNSPMAAGDEVSLLTQKSLV